MKPVASATQLQQQPSSPAPAHSRHEHTAPPHRHVHITVRRPAGHDTSPMVSGVFRRLALATAMAAALWLALGWALQ
jgi:hypothetical protein